MTVLVGDALERLRELPDGSVDCVATSPPFFGLRDYGTGSWEDGDEGCDHAKDVQPRSQRPGGGLTGGTATVEAATLGYREVCGKCGARRVDRQIGLENTPDEWCDRLVAVFRECRRVLADHGTFWLEVGDSYASGTGSGKQGASGQRAARTFTAEGMGRPVPPGLKQKDLLGQPWLLAQALRAPRYTGAIPQERDRVWLAATIDAEGCIAGNRHVRKDDGSIRTAIHVSITNTSKALLDEAARIWPASRQQHDSRDGSMGERPCWRWVANDVDRCSALMRELYPYLIVKRRQALLAFNFFEMSRQSKRFGTTKVGEEMRGRRDWIVAALSDLNHGRDIDLPKWIVEPPPLFDPGWYLRQCIIWHKPNCMPESARDRCTTAHSYVFLLTKRPRYWYDADAIAEPSEGDAGNRREFRGDGAYTRGQTFINADVVHNGTPGNDGEPSGSRNARSVWTIPTQGYPGAHYATWPIALATRMIRAGCPRQVCRVCGTPRTRIVDVTYEKSPVHGEGSVVGRHYETGANNYDGSGMPRLNRVASTSGWTDCGHNDYRPGRVLDPFGGSGTTGVAALREHRHAVLIELNDAYVTEQMLPRLRDWHKEPFRPVADENADQMSLL